jgi:CHAT domain-containing protein
MGRCKRISRLAVLLAAALFLACSAPAMPRAAKLSPQAQELNRAVRQGDLQEARRLVAKAPSDADQLFLTLLELDLAGKKPKRNQVSPLEAASHLAQVFREIYEYDLELGLIRRWEKADVTEKRQLLGILREEYVLHQRQRRLLQRPWAWVAIAEKRRLAAEFKELAARCRELDFAEGELQALLSANSLFLESAPRILQRAQSLGDTLGEVWKWTLGSLSLLPPEERAARLQELRNTARRLGTPKVEIRVLRLSASFALYSREFEKAQAYLQEALAIAREIPAAEARIQRITRQALPAEMELLIRRRDTFYASGQTDSAQKAREEVLALGRRWGGREGEATAVIQMLTHHRWHEGDQELVDRANALAREMPEGDWRGALLLATAEKLLFQPECPNTIGPATQALQIFRSLGNKELAAESARVRATCHLFRDEFAEAIADFQQAVNIGAEAGDPWLEAELCMWAVRQLPAANRAEAERFATRAIRAAEKVGDADQLAEAFRRRGDVGQLSSPQTLHDAQQALFYARRYAEESGEPSSELLYAQKLAREYTVRGDFAPALELLKQNAEKARAARRPRDEARALEQLGFLYGEQLGEPALGVQYGERAKKLFTEEKMPGYFLPPIYASLGSMNRTLGQPQKALEYWRLALEYAEKTKRSGGRPDIIGPRVYMSRARFYRDLGDYEAALGDLDKWCVTTGLRPEEARAVCLNEKALVDVLAGRIEQGAELARQAAASERTLPPGAYLPTYYPYFAPGDAMLLAGDYKGALAYFNQRRERARQAKSSRDELLALHGVGRAARRAGQLEVARDALRTAVELASQAPTIEGGGPAEALLALGAVEAEEGRSVEARNHLLRARDSANPYDINLRWQIERTLALTPSPAGEPEWAETHFEKALEGLESARERLRPEEFRLRFRIDRGQLYEEYASYLAARAVKTGDPAYAEKAFLVAERSRRQAAWDLLASGWSQVPSDALPDQVQRSRKLEVRLVAKQDILREQFDRPPEKRNAALIKTLEADLGKIKQEHAALIASLAQGKYRFAPGAALPEDLLAKLHARLGPKRVLLEYLVTDDCTFAFVVSSTQTEVQRLPLGRQELRRQVRHLLEPFRRLRSGEIDLARLSFDVQAAHRLYREIFAPLDSELGQASQILLVPDDVLHNLPLELLVERTPVARRTSAVLFQEYESVDFLLRHYTMSYLTAAAAATLETGSQSHPQGGTQRSLLAMANPISGPQAPQPVAGGNSFQRQLRSLGSALTALPGSTAEVEQIKKYFPADAVTIVTGKEASEANYKSLAAKEDVIHFATHAVASDDQPLYSTLVLAPGARAQEDGFLQAYEILRLPLQARLVVLSACETARGPLRQGEGLVGLVNAFQYAGADSVLATLWSIDESAAGLMDSFYRTMSGGETASVALQKAKLEQLTRRVHQGDAEFSLAHPFFWAPFLLIGNPDYAVTPSPTLHARGIGQGGAAGVHAGRPLRRREPSGAGVPRNHGALP